MALARDLCLDLTHSCSYEAGARPELARLLSDATEGRVSVLMVASLDQLGRPIPAGPQIIADLDHAGVTIYTADHRARPLAGGTTFAGILTAATPASSRLTR